MVSSLALFLAELTAPACFGAPTATHHVQESRAILWRRRPRRFANAIAPSVRPDLCGSLPFWIYRSFLALLLRAARGARQRGCRECRSPRLDPAADILEQSCDEKLKAIVEPKVLERSKAKSSNVTMERG